MKLLLTITLTALVTFCYAQINYDTPWMIEHEKKHNKKPAKFDDVVKAFEDYWKDKDHTVKGSGYKQFKRWQHRWEGYVKEDGTLRTSDELWEAWQQKKKMEKNNQLKSTIGQSSWTSIGPNAITYSGPYFQPGGQGRVNAVEVDPNNDNIIYVGTPAGGIWKSTNAGQTWAPLTDELPQIGVSAIEVDPNNSNIIYIGTGDDDHASSYGVGIYKSTNGGITWNLLGLDFSSGNFGNAISGIIVNPFNSNTIWVGMRNSGVHKSTDGGDSWNQSLLNGDIKDIREIRMKPSDPSIIYAVSNTTFYKSTNGGNAFDVISSGLPANTYGYAMAVTPANPNLVYLLSAKSDEGNQFNGIYKSTNAGASFTPTGAAPNQISIRNAWYNLAITISDTDPNKIIVGAVQHYISSDGGNNFTYGGSPFHPDVHYLNYFNGKLYVGNDGGIYRSVDDGSSYQYLSTGLEISQGYNISVAQQNPNRIVMGLQDNGGISYQGNDSWKYYHGGDGNDCAVDKTNLDIVYGITQNGSMITKSTNGGETADITVSKPGGEDGNWVTPINSNSQGEILVGYQKLYKISGNSMVALTQQPFNGAITDFQIDPNNDDVIYASVNTQLYKSTDGGVSFSSLSNFNYGNVQDIEVNSNNSDEVWFVVRNFYDSKVIKSTNGGNTFIEITYDLPSEPKNCIIHHAGSSSNTIYLGTDLGVYALSAGDTGWTPFTNNLPNAPVTDLDIHEGQSRLYAATFGRGMFISSISGGSATLFFNSCPNDIDIRTTPGANSAPVSWSMPTAYTTCNGSPTVSQTAGGSNGSNFNIGTSTITYQATDNCGNSSTCSFTVTVKSGDVENITITSPSMDDTYVHGDVFNIQWTDNISDNVLIRLYSSSGLYHTLASSTASNGSYSYPVLTAIPEGQYRIYIQSTTDNATNAYSDYFTIKRIAVTAPNSSDTFAPGDNMDIQWADNTTENVEIRMYSLSTGGYYTVNVSTASNGSYNYPILASVPDGQYRIYIQSTTDNTINDYGEYFTIQKPQSTITVAAPGESDTFAPGDNMNIQWTDNIAEHVIIKMYSLSTGGYYPVINSTASDGIYNYNIPSYVLDGQYRIKIESITDNTIYDYGEYFIIQTPSCTDGVQNGNETGVDCGNSCPPCPPDCPSIANRNGNITGSTQVENYIISPSQGNTATVSSSSSATFDAGTYISLNPGFTAEYGSVFHAFIDGCDDAGNKVEVEQTTLTLRNYPNPFTGQTTIEFVLPQDSHVTLFVSDMTGRKITTLLDNEVKTKGTHLSAFDGSHYPAGMYYYTIQAGEYIGTQKMILVK